MTSSQTGHLPAALHLLQHRSPKRPTLLTRLQQASNMHLSLSCKQVDILLNQNKIKISSTTSLNRDKTQQSIQETNYVERQQGRLINSQHGLYHHDACCTHDKCMHMHKWVSHLQQCTRHCSPMTRPERHQTQANAILSAKVHQAACRMF